MEKVYYQETLVNGKLMYAYASRVSIEELEKRSTVSFITKNSYYLYFSEFKVEVEGFKLIRLPNEQSLLSFFPFSLMYGREADKLLGVISDYVRLLRSYGSKVLCFKKGCRKPARFYAVSRIGLEGGCWYACSEEHFSQKTTKGFPLTPKDYLLLSLKKD